MENVEKRMNEIKAKDDPSHVEIHKYVRYLINVKKYAGEEVLEDVPHWELGKVESSIKSVERENSKPRPKRYYVSLKEPLEDPSIK